MSDMTARPRISPRELEIAKLKATGMTSKEVAFQLGISDQTVKNHMTNLYRTLDASTLEGALYAMGWLFPGGLTVETLSDLIRRNLLNRTSTARDTLDEVIAEGEAVTREARALKDLLDPMSGQ